MTVGNALQALDDGLLAQKLFDLTGKPGGVYVHTMRCVALSLCSSSSANSLRALLPAVHALESLLGAHSSADRLLLGEQGVSQVFVGQHMG